MRKIWVTFWLAMISLLFSNASMAVPIIEEANYGSVVIRDGTSNKGHAGVVISPLFGNQSNADLIIAQANGYWFQTGEFQLNLSSPVSYSTFKGIDNYIGHFKTYDTQWDSPAFRADVVKFANEAMNKSYTFINLYAYTGYLLLFNNKPYSDKVPTDFRCDGVAEWSVERALALHPVKTPDGNDGFYPTFNGINNQTHYPLQIATPAYGTDDSAFPLTINSDFPTTGVTMTFNTAGIKAGTSLSKGIPNILLSGSTGTGGTLKLLYSKGTSVMVTASRTAPNGNEFSSWDCTANGGVENRANRTCTISNMNKATTLKATYAPPVVTQVVPTVRTTQFTNVGSTSATLNATIDSIGSSSIVEMRFEWSPSVNGVAVAYNVPAGSGNTFSYVLTGLLPNTTYSYKAWARNSSTQVVCGTATGWGCGGWLSFTTGSGATIVNGICSSASNGGTFTTAPTNLCSSGSPSPSSLSGTGPWYWNCVGSGGGTTAYNCSANQTPQTWAVTPSAGAGGTISPSTAQTVNHGSTKTFTVTPNYGYTPSASGCGGYLSGTTYTTGTITANCTVSATFTINPVPVNGACGTAINSTYTTQPTQNLCSYGSAISMTGSGPWNWYCSGSNGGSNTPCSANVTPTGAVPSCNISPSAASIVDGTSQTFTASCTNNPSGYQWKVDGNLWSQAGAGPTSSDTFTGLAVGSHIVSVTANNSIGTSGPVSAILTVTQTQNSLTISKNGTGSGSVTSSPSGINCGVSCLANFNSGALVTLSATPATNSSFAGWSGGGCSGTGSCNVTMNSAQYVTATFNTAPATTFTVSTSPGANGSITPASQTVTQDNTTSFTVTPSTGYTASASGCGGSLVGSIYTTGAITANCTVSATFMQNATSTTTPIINDQFNGTTLDTSLWTSGGNSVTVHDGYLDLQANQTDNTGWVKSTFPEVPHIRVELLHKMHAGGDYFFPQVSLGATNANGPVVVRWLRSLYGPDYCSLAANYDRVAILAGITPNAPCAWSFSNLVSSSYFDRWITSIIEYDSATGLVTLDVDGDGTNDFSAMVDPANRSPITSIQLQGYGWWTGHLHQIDYIKVYDLSTAHAVIPASEREVLTNLYTSTNGASWINNTNWNGAVGTECTWFGIVCDGTQSHVVSVSLNANNLVGTLPSLGGLPALKNFQAYGNQLSGVIPSLSGLTALQEVNVYGNQLAGSIPSLNGLASLVFFEVGNNQLTGSIPSLSGLTALQAFRVGNNQLDGPVPAAPLSLNASGSVSYAGDSHLCGNSLASNGNPAIDAAWVAAAGNWLDCQTTTTINQTIGAISFAPATLAVGGTTTASANGGASGNAVIFTSMTTGICSVSGTNGSTVTGLAAGTCTIAANQAGSTNYNAASQVTQSIIISATGGATLSYPLQLSQGWQLLGNSIDQPLDVATTFGDSTKITTVWKWIPATSKWAFYAPSLAANGTLAIYAASKGFDALTTINPGEGYWVNAQVPVTLAMQTGASFNLTAANLGAGWNLVATGNDVTPSAFNLSLSATAPASGVVPINLTTLWAWDNVTLSWYFYAPALEANGTLASYIASNGYRDFTGKTLGNGTGFWVNGPGGNAADMPPATGADAQAPTVPAGLSAIVVGGSQVSLAWTASTDNAGVTQYKVYRDGALLTTLGAVTSYSDSVLVAGIYNYTVAACDAANNCSAQSVAATVTTTPDTQAPTVPAGLTATAVSGTQINLAWTASTDNAGVMQYKIYRDGSLLASLGTICKITSGSASDYVVGAPNCSSLYLNGGSSTVTTVADVPVGYTVLNFYSLLTCDSTEYKLQILHSLATNTSYRLPCRNTGATTTLGATISYSDSGLAMATAYSYAVAACDAAGNCSVQSTAAMATTPDTQAPTVPAGLTATASSGSQINLAWTASTDNVGVTQYKVYRGGALLTTLGAATSYSDSDLTTATVYSYMVIACDAAGNCSAQSTAAVATTPDTQPPTVPAGLAATASSGSQINLMWAASTDNIGVTQYKVYRGGALLTPVGGAVTSYSDSGLNAGTTYSYTVTACDTAGNCSQPSVAASATTLAMLPGAPTIGAAAAGNAQATVVFSAPANNGGAAIDGYTVTSNPAGGVDSNAGSTTLSHLITKLTNGSTYTFTVTAHNSAGTSAASAASNVVTPAAPVTNFTVTTSADVKGSITPASQTVTQDNTTSFTVTPSTGYTASASGCGGSLVGSIYTTGAITANCTVSATFTLNTIQTSLVPGWNLLGNSINAPLAVAATLGDATKITTVWKWIPATSKWAFYTPQQTDGGVAYAATKGYDALVTINGGEGFWVNAKIAFTAQLPAGTTIGTSYFQDNEFDTTQNKLLKGWNLIAVGDNVTPSLFNQALSLTPPAQGVIPLNVTTLWAWDSGLSSWYFYAPSLEASGGLANYIASKNYLDFVTRTLDPATGFWVNRP